MTLFSVAFEGDRPLQAYPKLARKAEEYGFHSFQIYEHIPYKPAWPIAFLAGRETKRIFVGPVTVPVFLHRPLTLARNLRALNELTNGRAILGISRGAYVEHITKPVDRSIRSVLEAVTSVCTLMGDNSEGRKTGLYVGTSGPRLAFKASQLSAVKGIVVDNLWNPEYAASLRSILDKAQQKSHRTDKVSLIARPFTMLGDSKEEAMKKINPILKGYLPHLVGNSPMLTAAGTSYQGLMRETKQNAKLPHDIVENLAAIGTPNEISEKVELMLKADVDHVCFGHPLGPDPTSAMALLAENVLPNFK